MRPNLPNFRKCSQNPVIRQRHRLFHESVTIFSMPHRNHHRRNYRRTNYRGRNSRRGNYRRNNYRRIDHSVEVESWLTEQRLRNRKIVWLVDPISAIPGEGLLPSRTWALARAYVAAGHDVIWWTSSFSHGAESPEHHRLELLKRKDSVSASLHHAATVPIFLADVLQVIVNLLADSRGKLLKVWPAVIWHGRIFLSRHFPL